jgi:ATP-dependent helicase HrpB
MVLPVEKIFFELAAVLQEKRAVVLTAPPGSGKTTRVPLFLQDAPWLGDKKILMLEPRRLAARLAAGYMAGLCGEKVGESVGYQVRFDRNLSAATRIEVITEGLLTRRLQQDPELADVGLVIFDEFHERSLDSDLALALCLDAAAGLRDDLRLLVMSATMDARPLSILLGDAPVIAAEGRMYPVDIRYLPPLPGQDSSRPDEIARMTARSIRQVLAEEQGDMLVFLPGVGEIRRVQRLLGKLEQIVVRPLHGSLSPAEQQQAIMPDPSGRQRVILATTIAETSVTIEGITVVVDSGWKRVPRFHPATGLTGLDTVRVSRASAEQRAGRAGRLGPGTCYRLWHGGVDAGLQEFDQPEIRQADLAPLVLELAQWGIGDPVQLAWLDPPPAPAVARGRELLVRLGALDGKGMITPLGREMARLPLHPRLAAMLVRGGQKNRRDSTALAALLSERDLPGVRDTADIEKRLELLRNRPGGRDAHGPFAAACRRIGQVSHQLEGLLRNRTLPEQEKLSPGGLLALAYPDRIARRRGGQGGEYQLVTGAGAVLPGHDPLALSEWLVVASQNVRGKSGRIFLAASLDQAEILSLFDRDLELQQVVEWDPGGRLVTCCERLVLGRLVLREQQGACPDADRVRSVLIQGIRNLGLDVLLWTPAARQLQARICCLRQWQPGEDWPDFSDSGLEKTLEQWLEPYLEQRRSIRDCNSLNLEKILAAGLDYRQRQELDQLAPTHVQVPSGSRVRLEYRIDGPPVLAVRLQEMFGLAETPAVCRGRVPVLLHLLSPARRPVQVTQDLRGFWDSSYFDVRRELKGRYPKHHWPEKPWEAQATARVKPRKKRS